MAGGRRETSPQERAGLPQLRKDPIIGRWVIISSERARRPTDFVRSPVAAQGGSSCPFCPGNEQQTPPEVMAYRRNDTAPDTPGWSLRVVPNKFPALSLKGELDRTAEGLFDRMSGVGAHEVVIESPHHPATLEQLPLESLADVLRAYRDRMVALGKDPRSRYLLIFKNYGSAAGASLEHSHTQLIALPIVPRLVREELEAARRYHARNRRCVYCDLIRQERQAKERLIAEHDGFLTLAPYAPRFPFETWVLPTAHSAVFEQMEAADFGRLARALQDLLRRSSHVLNRPPYNLVLHTAPLREDAGPYYHWHLEFMPMLIKIAGFEWGTGFYVNPTPPEDAARALREATVTS
ncbi:MAG: galactose-1-phosphate uridylyltransferase [Terriglobia bacterium]